MTYLDKKTMKKDEMEKRQNEYIANWHDSFVRFIDGLIGYVEMLMNHPQALDDDKHALNQVKMMLHGKDAKEIERSLAEGMVSSDLLDKIAKLEKDLAYMGIDHLTTDQLVKEFLKTLLYLKVEQDKQAEKARLENLQIKI